MAQKKTNLVITATAILGAILMVQHAYADPINLDTYQWENRLIIAFSPSTEDASYQSLKAAVENEIDKIKERDILFIQVLGTETVQLDNEAATYSGAAELRNRYDIPPDQFAVLLIGKDGGLKLRQGTDFDLSYIFALIDTMPMRQQEMSDSKRGVSN